MHIPLSSLLALSLVAGSTAQDWIQNPGNGHLYARTTAMTWTGAEAFAQAIGARLATINDQAEQSWVTQTFAGTSNTPLWIGLSDDGHPGIWTWSDGETSFFTAWAPGQPDRAGGVEHWVEMLPGNGSWNDRSNVSQPALLEMRPRWRWNVEASAPFNALELSAAVDPLHGVAVVSGGLLGLQTAEFDGVTWRVLQTSPGLASTSLAFDGIGVIAVSSHQTWRWNGTSWNLVSNSLPAPNDGAKLAYDPRRGCVVAFGGVEGFATSASTWEWHGSSWTLVHPAHCPPARAWHALSYHDASAKIVVFGGGRDLAGQNLLADTWTWDGLDWVQSTPAHQPVGRSHHCLVDVPTLGFVLLHGGRDANGDLSDSWEWNGVDWTPQSTEGPTRARSSHAAFLIPRGSRSGVLVVESATSSRSPQVVSLVSASYDTYRVSCPGSCGTPALYAVTPPRVGSVFTLRVSGICPRSIGYLFFTLDDRWLFQNPATPLPFALGVIGAPGCFINVDTAHRNSTTMLLVDSAGIGSITVPIGLPNVPVLLGYEFYNQFVSVDPAANSLGLATTNAGHGIVGY